METQVDLKWISVVSLGTLVALLLNYDIAGGPCWYRDNLVKRLLTGSLLFFSSSTF